MMVELTYALVLDTIRTAGILVGIYYYIMTLRNTNRNRQASLFSTLQHKMDSTEFRRAYRTIKYTYSDKTPEEMWDIFQENPDLVDEVTGIISFFNHMGWLVQRGLLDIDAVIGNSVDVVSFYELARPILDDWELRTGFQQNFPPLTYLYNEMKKQHDKIEKERKKAQETRYG